VGANATHLHGVDVKEALGVGDEAEVDGVGNLQASTGRQKVRT
jgi:hypothetical protein